MDKPKELWIFDNYNLRVMGPYEITGESDDGKYWHYEYDGNPYSILKDKASYTRKWAMISCWIYHRELLEQEQIALDEKKRLLKKFYSEG